MCRVLAQVYQVPQVMTQAKSRFFFLFILSLCCKNKTKMLVWLRRRLRIGLRLIFNGKTKHFCKGWMDLIYRTVFGFTCFSSWVKAFPMARVFLLASLFSVFLF